MDEAELLTYFALFFLIGFSTYFFRAIFLFKYPDLLDKSFIRKGLESVPSSLLVALVIPFTLFVDGNLIFFRNEVYAILLSLLVLWYIKKPGLSLILAILILFGLNIMFPIA